MVSGLTQTSCKQSGVIGWQDIVDKDNLNDACMLDSSSDEELEVVIEEEDNIARHFLSGLVEAVEQIQLVPTIRLCLAWLSFQSEVLAQTGPITEQLWQAQIGPDVHMFMMALQEKNTRRLYGW